MKLPRRTVLLALCLALLAGSGSVHAQPSRPLQIKDVRLGLPAGKDGRRCRIGAWSPVYVDLAAGKETVGTGDFELVTETADSDDVRGQYVIDVPAIAKESSSTVLTYFRPGNRTAKVTVRVRRKGGAVIHSLDKEPEPSEEMGPDEVLYLVLGAGLPGLHKALMPPRQAEGGPEQEAQLAERAEHSIARIERPGDLPNRWFGYDGVDVVVLSTSSDDFLNRLLDASRPGSAGVAQALGEWLHRGGRLVISVGRNYQRAAELLKRLDIPDFAFQRPQKSDQLREVQQWAEARSDLAGLEVAPVQAPAGTLTLAAQHTDGKASPVLTLVPCGLGRVLLVAFDLNAKEFTTWKDQELFWKRLHEDFGPRTVTRGKDQDAGDRPGELAGSLQRGLENFEQIPVISFGWVAFFILVYILIIGPLDYFFLKKVVKRLELTWVTFPVVVLVVSVAAYFTAYALKGNDRRINKIDVVDIDLRSGDVQGTMWLALFSPRLESYTLGVEPAWTAPDAEASTVVATHSPPDNSIGGVERPGSQSLFRRPYIYAAQAAGLKDVPVPVWASRSFTASWQVKAASNNNLNAYVTILLQQQPLVAAACSSSFLTPSKGDARKLVEVAGFGLSRDGQRLTGRIDNHLPAELHDVTLLYAGRAYPLDNIPARGTYRIDARDIRRSSGGASTVHWLDTPFARSAGGQTASSRGESDRKPAAEVPAPSALMKAVLFHGQEAGPYSHLNNSDLRRLDQGWRLRGFKVAGQVADKQYLDEAILVGRAVLPSGPAEEVAQDGVSATRLWLGSLPGEGKREPLKGYLSQETYVRIYIPVPRTP
jgi:hypothetical protein